MPYSSSVRNLDNNIADTSDIPIVINFEDVNFIEAGMLDSFDVINLVTDIEEKFGIQIDGSDILPENFCSIDSIKNLIILSGGKI